MNFIIKERLKFERTPRERISYKFVGRRYSLFLYKSLMIARYINCYYALHIFLISDRKLKCPEILTTLLHTVITAPDVLAKINEYLPLITEMASREIGSSLVHLSSRCACSECNFGSFICDAFMDAVSDFYLYSEGLNYKSRLL